MIGFLAKNRDTLQPELLELLNQSTNSFVVELFTDQSVKNSKSTLATQFKESLRQLMDTLHSTTPYHILCIKPNSLMEPKLFDDDLVKTQLNYVGMLGIIKIRKLGFLHRFSIEEFCARYSLL